MNPNLARTLAHRAKQLETPAYGRALQEKDRNDCTVVAFQHLTGRTYMEAHRALKETGRGFRQGLHHSCIKDYLDAFRKLGFTVTRVGGMSLQGKFLVLTEDHAAAVVNGTVVNGLGRRLIIAVYEIS